MSGRRKADEMMVESKEWYLSAYASEGVPTSDHLKLRTRNISLALDMMPEQHVALEVLWVSPEPHQRSIMSGRDEGLYLPQFSINEVIKSFGIGRVIRSKNTNFKEGDLVTNAFTPVAEYYMGAPDFLKKIDPTAAIALPEYISSLGLPGFTAWVGIEVIANIKPGSNPNVFISAAAGAVGLYAGQLAKLKGCRLVGSTGSADKVKLLKVEFGYDDAFNYHTEADLDAALSKYFPNGIDIYFDNVGGKMLEAVLNHVNKGAQVLLCGMISQYNKAWSEMDGIRNMMNVVGKEVKMEGFLVGSHLHRMGEFEQEMQGYVRQAKIVSKYKIYQGIDGFLDCFASIFSSSNAGKVLIQIKV